ncbi:hypothetical protein FA893_18185 [Photobacterium damselae subsp. piscicida]|uniref:hypothetical protein n=1 Tax=Photobacterium damselae TaxID=38293 RepID=UPI0005C75077|nr:hypothetical protein [Photobacterium damselae]OLQ78703.1 hypothetical protein BEI67_19060 [Photobacterium damselae subsp. piscicida]TFZ63956.1 hypothetical protein E4T25_01450 [Photobacterium damselae subsp. piscicida]TJZ82331.1 hypothetical protein FA893_18185 [Photobacterium damselae subsp. piscicida]
MARPIKSSEIGKVTPTETNAFRKWLHRHKVRRNIREDIRERYRVAFINLKRNGTKKYPSPEEILNV